MSKEIFYKRNDIANTILDYIGSEEFEKAITLLDDNPRSSFFAGLAMAGVVIFSKCEPYIELKI